MFADATSPWALLLLVLVACSSDAELTRLRTSACRGQHAVVLAALDANGDTAGDLERAMVRLRYRAVALAALQDGAALDEVITRHEELVARAPDPLPLERGLMFADIAHRRRVLPGTARLLAQLETHLRRVEHSKGTAEPSDVDIPACTSGRTRNQARALTALRLGTGLLQQARFDQARTHFDRGIELMERAGETADRDGERSYYALLYNNRAELSLELAQVAQSIQDRKRAISVAQKAGAMQTLALAQGGLAMTGLEAEVAETDLLPFLEATRAARAGLEQGHATQITKVLLSKLRSLDALLRARAVGPRARQEVTQGVAAARHMLKESLASDYDRLGVEARAARALYAVGDWPLARAAHVLALKHLVSLWEAAPDASHRRGAMGLYAEVAARALAHAHGMGDLELALHAMERSKDIGLLQRYARTKDESASDASLLSHLTVPGAVDLTTLTGSLSPNEAFIHVDRAFDQIIWLVVRPGSALTRSQPVADLESLLEQLQYAWPTEADPLPLLRALHARLLAPIQHDLPAEGAIIISPRGGLHNVPWPALQGKDGRFWVERHATTLVPSAGAFLALRAREGDAPSAATGTLMVTGSSHFDPDKIRKAAGLGPDVPLIERVAQVSGVDSDVLLVTAHGHFDASHPEASYLQLVPTAREPGRLTLSALSQARIKARVVVLHACDAARSVPTFGDEADSFVRAFLAGGARSVLAPLGSLDRDFADRMLSELMPSLRAGEAPAQVLARVQRRMLRGAGRTTPEDPRHWGTIVAAGAAL